MRSKAGWFALATVFLAAQARADLLFERMMHRLQAASECDLVFRGVEEQGHLGMSIASVGDVNGDGLRDFALSAPGSKAAFVVLGRRFSRGINDMGMPLGMTGVIVILADSAGERFGWSVAGAGDFNGDGVDDIVIGWPGAKFQGPESGCAILVLGNGSWRNDDPPLVLATSSFTGAKGFLLRGHAEGDFAGACVAGGGDFNDDGLDDIVIAAPGAGPTTRPATGKFYVVFGNEVLPNVLDLEPAGMWGFHVTAAESAMLDADTSTTVCTWPGDVNGDGFDDLLLGAPRYSMIGYPAVGGAWVVFGRSGMRGQTVFVEEVPETVAGLRITIDPTLGTNGHLGLSVAGVGDIDGDHLPEFAVAYPDPWDQGIWGKVAVFFGSHDFPSIIDLSQAFDGFWIIDDAMWAYERFGISIAPGGDLNNDGVVDILIGATSEAGGASPLHGSGSVYVYYGEPTGKDALLSQSGNRFVKIVGVFGSRLPGEPGDLFGWSVCGPGDLNGDGVDDLLVGAPFSRTTSDATSWAGNVFGFFFEPPRIVSAYLSDPNGNGRADPGETIHLVLSRRVMAIEGPIEDLFFLSGGGQLGSDALVRQLWPGSNRIQVVLDSETTGIVAVGNATAIDFNALGQRGRVVGLRLGVNVIDSQIAGVNDAAIDIRLPFRAVTAIVPAQTGGIVAVPADPDANYAGHSVSFPPGSLAADAVVELRQMPDPPGDFGLGSAVWFSVSQPFTLARLTLGYREEELPPWVSEGQMRIVRLPSDPDGQYQILPGDHVVDPVNNTVSVNLHWPVGESAAEVGSVETNGYSGGFAGLPIETVDERNVGMRPEGGKASPVGEVKVGLAPSWGKRAEVTLTPGPESIYLKHKLVFHDFVTSTPGSVVVTIRTATLAERTYTVPIIGSQYFPDQSDAIFTIETTDASQNPVSFTSPVDITVEFKTSNNPKGYSDVIDFDENPGDWSQMRIVRSVQDPTTYVPNFVFVGGNQWVDRQQSTVTVYGFTQLTDNQGKATYGAVVDTSVSRAGHWLLYR